MESITEFELLKKKALETDFSLSNPKMRVLIAQKIAGWVKYYETKGYYPPDKDAQGNPKAIPDEIDIEGKKYHPQEILKSVQKEDELGKVVLQKIYDKWHKEELCIARQEVLTGILNELPKDLSATVMKCPCGEHYQTTRMLLEGIINCDSHLFFSSMAKSVAKLYQKSE